MRLEKIKLAGFKSFVDPTTVPFPSNLVGVVGPNGCGKSNVIDAVRWVMGESSAKMLRGESMADVIFNGSNTRKPVGMASIELIFDNADGSAGGQYAQYAQISVRRQVTRDGQSFYALNGIRCRRRDITDLFLGTGLGPRSYAIIEQGMISRIIESRPEELRVYLEEAAGISKYKERRRETESRIRATRENLDRLNDLREEVAKQLRHLERQAATAEKYRVLKAESRQVNAELLCLRLIEMERDAEVRERNIAAQDNELQSAIADLRRIEAEIEQNREAHHEGNDDFNEIQGRYYALGAEIARLEEGIQYARESRRQNQAHLDRALAELAAAESHSVQDQDRLESMASNLKSEQPELELARAQAEEAGEAQSKAEAEMAAWQTAWDEFNAAATQPAQLAQVERARINHLEQQEMTHRRRLERLSEELERMSDLQLQAEINELEQREREQREEIAMLSQTMSDLLETISVRREQNESSQALIGEHRGELEMLKGRLASLQALQQSALGSEDQSQTDWAEENGLTAAKRLLDLLEVDDGWQRAVETVLAQHLQSWCVGDLQALGQAVSSFTGARLGLFQVGQKSSNSGVTLAAKVRGPESVLQMLEQVLVASDAGAAFALQARLEPGRSVITPQGLWLGAHWLRWTRKEDASAGLIERGQEIRTLGERQQHLQPMLAELVEQLNSGRQALAEAEAAREQQQRALDSANKSLSESLAQLGGKRARREHTRQRVEALQAEMEEIREQLLAGSEQMESSRTVLHQALAQMEALGAQREQWVARRERLQNALRDAREGARASNSRAHQIALRVESMRSSEQSLRSGLERMHSQLSQLRERCEELRGMLASADEPVQMQQMELESKLEQRMGVEAELGKARKLLEEIDHRLRELDRARHLTEQQSQTHRDRLGQLRLALQEVLVRARTLEEQLGQTGLARLEVEAQMAEDAEVGVWKERAEQLEQQIGRLGSINLAAIDEFKEQTERMTYLDAQFEDVSQSLATLEDAIAKIDRETRTRFRDTFDRVNTGLQTMFPKLFGGGHAYLEMTGEDLLDAGVAIMARPPGKRNSSIHLLSGGEKALSAVALVFSIFQLNPAPFCMLDEVDAPLDDANVGRFCALVKEMSAAVQFIFITHNKVTMEIANQLIGVTMHEPGCSRPVSVDIEEAAQMAVS